MKIAVETHCHTLQSKHAKATLTENIERARALGMAGICITNHGPKYGDSPSEAYFEGLLKLPKTSGELEIFRGVELNILDDNGTVDLPKNDIAMLDWVIASIHSVCFFNHDKEYITNAYINALKNPHIHCLGHIGQAKFPCDFERIIKTACEYDKIIEINNSSLTGMRKGAGALCREVIALCKKYGVKIAVSSDAHEAKDVGNFNESLKLVEEIDFPSALIINSDIDKFKNYIKK